jgi:hypothetical protein
LQRVYVCVAVQVAPILRIPPRNSTKSWERGTRRERDRFMQLQAGIGRVLVSAYRVRKNINQNLRIRTVNARPDAHSRPERPLPADICGLLSPQAACSLCFTQGMHARSWQLPSPSSNSLLQLA